MIANIIALSKRHKADDYSLLLPLDQVQGNCLEDKWKDFKLTETEEEEIKVNETLLADETKRGEFCLIGKLVADKIINKEVIRTTMSKARKTTKGFTIYNMKPNLFIFSFGTVEDKRRMLNGKPWLFDANLLVLHTFDGHTSPSTMVFKTDEFCVHMHNLLMACMNYKMGKQIENAIGV